MKLVVVPTPIGNLEDITLRAIRVLREADCILAEDTRETKKLLMHLGITNQVISYHQHNEHRILDAAIQGIQGRTLTALVSDAGTPGISDPGFLLVRECVRQGIDVECLPGPTAFVPALVVSGIPCDTFHFEGFLPHKKGRETQLKFLATHPHTVVFYESPHRIVKTLTQLVQFFGPTRLCSVSREITKKFEETFRGDLQAALDHFQQHEPRGEFVVVVEGLSE